MNTLEKTLRWIVIGGIFLLPFIPFQFGGIGVAISNSNFFPYITGKNFAFRIIVEIITAAWLALALVYPKYRPQRSPILGAFALFVIVMTIADAQGVYPFKSFWSNYERMDGWITIAHTLLYTVVAASMINTEKLWRRLFQTSLAVSLYVSLYGLLQVLGLAALGQATGTGLAARVDATFGNPIYMAVYMLFNIFIAALLWYRSWTTRKPGTRAWPAILYGFVIAADTLALLLTETRGTMLGLIGGGVVALILIAFFDKSARIVRRVSFVSVVAVVVLGAGLYIARDTYTVQHVGFLNRLATISSQDATSKARVINWQIAWRGVQERPLLGWGQENYAIVFDKYYDPRMYGQEQWFDRVHNIIFDWLVAGGFLGLLSYLAIFAATLWVLWKSQAFSLVERSIITGMLVGYFIHNFFVFDNVTSYILWGTVLAYIAYRSHPDISDRLLHRRTFIPHSYLAVAASIASVAALGAAYAVNANAIAANHALIQGLMPYGDPLINLHYMDNAISYGTYGTQEAREQMVQAAAGIANANVSPDIKKRFLIDAATQETLQARMSPMDARAPLFVAMVEDVYGDYKDAQAALQRAHELSPAKQSILYEMGSNAFARGDSKAAAGYFEQAYVLDKENQQAHDLYVQVLVRTGVSAEQAQAKAQSLQGASGTAN